MVLGLASVLVGALVLLFVVARASDTPAISSKQTSNAAVRVDLLFEHEGCRVFRFEADGRDRYFARCPCSVDTVGSHSEQHGHATHVVDDAVRTELGR